MGLRTIVALLWFCCVILRCTSVNDAADSTAGNAALDSRPSEDGISRETDPGEETGGGSESGEWESASGSGSGSGGDGGAGDVATCSEVPHAGDGEVEDITSSTAYTAVSCHLSCMEEVANSSEFLNARYKSGRIAGVWSYHVFPEFDKADRRNTCPAYKKFRECQRGCLVRTHQNKTILRNKQCKKDCRDECVDSRRTNSQYNAYCEVDCNATNCLLGCKKYSNIKRSQNTLTTPHGPVAAPVLVSSMPGFFKVNLTKSAPTTGTLSPVGFVYRIEDQLTGATVFLSQVDPMQSLNLTQFPCRKVLVSFVVVNKYGASTESPATTIILPGPLNPPTIQRISTVMDTRLGFFGYGVVTVSWQHPLSSVHIDHYVVKVFALSHSGNHYFSDHLSRDTTSLTMKVEEKKNLFWLGTRHEIEVCSISGGKEKCTERDYTLPTISGTSVLQIASCTSQWNGTQFNYTVEWTIPDFIAFADGIIDSFNLGANLLHNGKPQSGFRSKVAHKRVNKTRYTYTWTNFNPRTSAYAYKFSVSIHWAEGPHCCEVVSDDCSIQAIPPPSSPVLNVTISAITFPEGNIQFDFSWKPPTSTNGDVTEYLACLSSRVLEDEEDPPHYGSDDLTCVDTNKMSTSHIWNTRIPRPECLFFQMRAHTQYRKGLWSKEDIISTKPYDRMTLECHVIEGSTSDSSAIEVSWTVQNGTLCSHLEDVSLERLNITLEAAVKGSSLMSKLGSVTLPMGRGKYTFGNISMANSSQYLVMLQASWKGIKFYEDALISDCVEEQPLSSPPSVATLAMSVSLGAAIAIIGTASVILFCGLYWRRRKFQQALKLEPTDKMDLMFSGGIKKPLKGQNDVIVTDEWEIPPSLVIVEGMLGEGAFGEVHKGTLRGPLSNPKIPTAVKSAICIPVAIKMLKASAKGSERRDFLLEIEMMKKVSEGQNPHVVAMVGCVTVQEPLSLITEFVAFGNLLNYLRTSRRMYTEPGEHVEGENPYVGLGSVTSLDLISFAYQIASGMEYLSSLGVVHRDLACRNILVGEGKVLKITDLGMSRETDEVYVQKTKGRVPLKWMAVESIITREFTSASDVWAYGVILWEIGTLGGFPYPSILNEDLLPLLKQGYRMEKPDNCSPEVYDIMLKCWQEDPNKRPTFPQLRAQFDSMLLEEKKETYIDLQIDASKPYYKAEPSEVDEIDPFREVSKGKKKWGSHVSIGSSPEDAEKPPSHSSSHHGPLVQLRGQRSPRSLSPVPAAEKPPRPVSLQLLSNRQNANHYVDDPSSRRSIMLALPEWGPGHQRRASEGTVAVDATGMEGNGRGGEGEGGRAGNEGHVEAQTRSAVPDIFISFS